MFNTEFTYVNNTYRLVVDSTLAVKTAAWLEQQGVVFDRYFKHEGFCKFIFISAPDKAIALITAKYPLFSTTPVKEAIPEALFVSNVCSDGVNVCHYFLCKSAEEASAFASHLRKTFVTKMKVFTLFDKVAFAYGKKATYLLEMDSDTYNRLVQRFGVPITADFAAPVQICPEYYFADCYTPASIKAKYRKLSKLHHPDCGGDSETFTAIANQYQEAMTNLS
jgi:hypothetical protein